MFLAEMDEQIKGLLNKYIIDSIYKRDSTKARNIKLALYVDWPGETHNGRAF
jgi:hypothetical protein